MTTAREHHGTILLHPETARPIETIRRAWDRDMAAAAANVTLVYQQEAPRALTC